MVDNFEKVPPHSIEAEMAVLGSMMIERTVIDRIIAIVSENCFYSESHKTIFQAIRALYETNSAVDVATVSAELKKQKKLTEIGGASYLVTLIESVPTAANAEDYANIVGEKKILRELIRVSHDIISDSYKDETPPRELLDKAEHKFFEIRKEGYRSGFEDIENLIDNVIEQIESFVRQESSNQGLRTGFYRLDELTGGLQKSNMIIVAGRPGMGKTSLCLNIVEHVALKEKKPVALFTLEMSRFEIALRLLCSQSRINLHKMRSGKFERRAWDDILSAAGRISESPIYINELNTMSMLDLRAQARRLMVEKGLSLIVVDYLQMLSGVSRRWENRQQEISDISRSMKSLARELDLPILVASQLSRRPEERGRDPSEPRLSDLRESGAIEQDADVVIFIYRDFGNKNAGEQQSVVGTAKVKLAKQRNGPVGDFELTFLNQYARFENMASEQKIKDSSQ